MEQITIQDYRGSILNSVTHRKSQLLDNVDIDSPLYDALVKFQQGVNWLGFVSKDRTQLQGSLYNSDILLFITSNWSSDISIFREPVKNLDFF